MIEAVVLDYLSGCLQVPVYMEVPENPPDTYVVIEKTGSGRENWIDSAVMAIQSYAASLYEVATLNEQVKAAMDAIIELPEISRSELNSDYNYTDTTTKRYRYQAVYDLVHY